MKTKNEKMKTFACNPRRYYFYIASPVTSPVTVVVKSPYPTRKAAESALRDLTERGIIDGIPITILESPTRLG